MDISIKYISAGLARCDRNGMCESGAIATIDSKRYYFSIYSTRVGDTASSIQDFLEIPENLSEACAESGFRSLLETLRKEIELKHGRPLTLDLSKGQSGTRPHSFRE
jgi:hypothetical protein